MESISRGKKTDMALLKPTAHRPWVASDLVREDLIERADAPFKALVVASEEPAADAIRILPFKGAFKAGWRPAIRS